MEAREWLTARHGDAAVARVSAFLDMVIAENGSQNLIAPGTIPAIWSRHALDSAQLLGFAPESWETWLDIGTGGGFPGFVIAVLEPDRQVTMVEPRQRRASFLAHCAERLGLGRATVIAGRVEAVSLKVDVVSARAVASVENVLRAAGHCAKDDTTWLLPRGQSGAREPIDTLPMFHVEHSLTDARSVIVVGRGRPNA